MTHVLHTEIELDLLTLEIDLEYDFTPGERMVRYYRDGSGDPGCPPSVDLVSVTVRNCSLDTDQQKRDNHWIWRALDTIATELVSREWNRYSERCIEDANDRSERDCNE